MSRNSPTIIPESFASVPLLTDAYESGWNHGHGFACHNVPSLGDKISRSVDYMGLGSTVDAANIREYHAMLCHAAEENSRSYSPFDFTAHEFNGYGDGGFKIESDSFDVPEDVYSTEEEARDAAKEEGITEFSLMLVPSSDELWEAFDAGIRDSISADLSEYSDSDYGIEEEEEEEEEEESDDESTD